MMRALTTAATGLDAQQANIERISNDIANVNTDGYKRSANEFHDLMYQTIKEPGASLGATSQTPVGIQQGLGVKVGSIHKQFEPGPAKMTYHMFDLMIEGKGFFPVQTTNGEIAYTRTGNFHRDNTGRLSLTNGAVLIPPIVVPAGASNMRVTPQGQVTIEMPGGQEIGVGQIQLVNFVNEEGLSSLGTGMYRPTIASGQPIQGVPGENGLGNINQGALEGSNVNIATSMVEMINTQRAYEMNTKVMQAADQMLGATVSIK